jgi:hypothetical protein
MALKKPIVVKKQVVAPKKAPIKPVVKATKKIVTPKKKLEPLIPYKGGSDLRTLNTPRLK